jgi:hypothetical protein
MDADYGKILEGCYNIQRMTRGLPRDIKQLFLPETADGLAALEERIKHLRKWEKRRWRVMMIQNACGFSFRPNEFLHETETRARIYGLKHNDLPDQRKHTGDQGGWPGI